jgi:SAM-dependent methyltransferase
MSHPRASLLKTQLSTHASAGESRIQEKPNLTSERAAMLALREERQKLAKEIPSHIIKKAWFCLSHLLLDSDATIIDAGCLDGKMTYAMAALHPDKNFIGIDINRNFIDDAHTKYNRENLTFRADNLFENFAKQNSVDAIINSFFLHEVYSASQYNPRAISKILDQQYKALKHNGYILIRDFIVPPSNEYVLIEFKDIHDKGNDIETMSEADLLIWFSEKVCAADATHGAGFFLEEIPPTYPNTRMFRLPIKWAYEFINRKDDRKTLLNDIHKEYAFFTEQEFRRELRAMGMRVVYSGPHWDDGFLKTRYDGKVRLYKEDGSNLGPPPNSFMILAQKVTEKRSHIVLERRASRSRKGKIHLRTVRDDRTGKISDIATRDLELAEIIPYRVDENGKLKIYLHENYPRGLVNAVPRSGRNLDGRTWSGHLTEAITIPTSSVQDWENQIVQEFQKITQQKIGVRASLDSVFENGPGFYPDPYRIDERIVTHYYRTESYHKLFPAKHTTYDADQFPDIGRIREFDAQDILNAITVGLIPAPRLETQILALSQRVKIPVEVWEDMPIHLSEVKAEDIKDLSSLVKKMSVKDTRFKDIKGSAGNIRVMQSVFVDEGRDETGGATSLAARDIEFIHADDSTVNTAVILPLVKDLSGEVLAGICTEYLPVPQRYRGNGMMATLPSFPLPKEITDMDSARRYIAEKFRLDAKFVGRMGESYFTHIGITPHRIFPFVVSNTRFAWAKGIPHGATQLAPLSNLWKMLYWDNHDSFIKIAAMAYKNLCQDSSLSVRWNFDSSLTEPQKHTLLSESTYVNGGEVTIPSTTPMVGQDYETISSVSDPSKIIDTKLDSFHFPNPKRT